MLVRTETALTYAGARVALEAALARAEQIGGAFNVAVTDTAGTSAGVRPDGRCLRRVRARSPRTRPGPSPASAGWPPTSSTPPSPARTPSVRASASAAGSPPSPVACPSSSTALRRAPSAPPVGPPAQDKDVAAAGAAALRRLALRCAAVGTHRPISRRGRTMTPFMLRVAEIVGTPEDELPDVEEIAPMPETRISRRIATGTGADRQVAIRSLAEQLVSEANAILGPADDRLDLVDETLPHELAFRVTHREPSGSGVDDVRGRHGLRPPRRRRLRRPSCPRSSTARTRSRTSSFACSSSPASPTTTSPESPRSTAPKEAPCSTNCEPRSSSRRARPSPTS